MESPAPPLTPRPSSVPAARRPASASSKRPSTSSSNNHHHHPSATTTVDDINIHQRREHNVVAREEAWRQKALREWKYRKTVLQWRDSDRALRIRESRSLAHAAHAADRAARTAEIARARELDDTRRTHILGREQQRLARERAHVHEIKARAREDAQAAENRLAAVEQRRAAADEQAKAASGEAGAREAKRAAAIAARENARAERNRAWYAQWAAARGESLPERMWRLEASIQRSDAQAKTFGRAGVGGRNADESAMNARREDKCAQRERLRTMREVDRLKVAPNPAPPQPYA